MTGSLVDGEYIDVAPDAPGLARFGGRASVARFGGALRDAEDAIAQLIG